MSYDYLSPSQGHSALSDIDQLRANTNALRANEVSASTSPPSNPTGGQLWWTSDTKAMYQRKTDNSGWSAALWYETDPPVLTTTFDNHKNLNITNSVTVHGIKQGSGNGLDADLLDGQHASAFLVSSHATAISSTHGVGAGEIAGTTLTQTFSNKTFASGCSITANISVGSGVTIDGRDLSVDGAKLDTYPGNGVAAPSDASVTPPKFSLQPTAGDYSICVSTGEVSTGSTSYVKVKEIRVGMPGTFRVKFYLKGSYDAGIPQNYYGYGKIYKNGVTVGQERSVLGATYALFSEDIAASNIGDLIQVYCHSEGWGSAAVKDLHLCVNVPLVAGALIS